MFLRRQYHILCRVRRTVLLAILLTSFIIFITLSTPIRFFSLQCGFEPFTKSNCFTDNREHNYRYIQNEPRLCDGDVFLLIMVPCIPEDFTARQNIRKTWGSFASRSSNVRLAFILGIAKSEAVKEKLIEESATYHDIIQKDFIDSYRNLSLKSESILHFTSYYCPNAQFLAKTDTDVFLNVPLLLNNLYNSKIENITGRRIFVAIPKWHKSSKWYIAPSDYPFYFYPAYTDGFCYVMPQTVIKPLFQMSLKTRLLPMEDVHVTGIVRSRLSLPVNNNYLFNKEVCKVEFCYSFQHITCILNESDDIDQVWNGYKKCSE